jgi:hypothetical protein
MKITRDVRDCAATLNDKDQEMADMSKKFLDMGAEVYVEAEKVKESNKARQSAPDLLVIAKEVGVSFSSNRPSIRAMREAILGKVRESMLLSRHSPRLSRQA